MNQPATASVERLALITGAARRIGREIALHLARQGWNIAVHYHHSSTEAEQTAQEIRALGRKAEVFCCDLADEAAVRALLPAVNAAMGTVDCVVNNASLFSEDHAHSFSYAMLNQHMHANLGAPLLLAQALHAQLQEGQQGSVINLLDQKLFNLNPDFLSYTLSKAALQTATVMLAQALAPKIRVVGVAPGITMVSGHQTEADFAAAHQITPLGRSSTPQDIARTVAFVADSPAMTGTTLLVDGGQHLIPLQRDVMYLATANQSQLSSE